MIVIQETLISEDILEKNFICNIEKCKGKCCVEGTSGAPLANEEITIIADLIDSIKPYMSDDGLGLLKEKGYHEIDGDGDAVTTCLPTGECVFVVYDENKQLACAIQKAYHDEKVNFEKPISCHLYPIRIAQVGDYTALNYHQWNICSDACKLGNELKTPVYQFLKQPLMRRFGAAWYSELEEIAGEWGKTQL